MKFYTVQSLEAFKKLKKTGVLENVPKDKIMEDYEYMYTWMKEKLSNKIGRVFNGFPIWLWLDTLNVTVTLDEGECVVLEVDIPEEDVLLSNYEAWHVILNEGTFDLSKSKDDLSIEELDSDWKHLFDRKFLEENGFTFENIDMQAVTDKIYYENVKVLRYITKEVI